MNSFWRRFIPVPSTRGHSQQPVQRKASSQIQIPKVLVGLPLQVQESLAMCLGDMLHVPAKGLLKSEAGGLPLRQDGLALLGGQAKVADSETLGPTASPWHV